MQTAYYKAEEDINKTMTGMEGKTVFNVLLKAYVTLYNINQFSHLVVRFKIYRTNEYMVFNWRSIYEESDTSGIKDLLECRVMNWNVDYNPYLSEDVVLNILIKKGEIKMEKRKLFISCPMKGRTDENIKKSMEVLRKTAELMFGEEFDVIDSFIENNPPKTKNERIWYLGESLKMLAEADAFIGVAENYMSPFPGCEIELGTARRYGLDVRTIYIEEFACFDDITKAPCTPVPGDMAEIHECTCEPEGCCNDGCCAIDFGEE